MTERELREKLQSAYGTMPDATRAAFEHSLTHHRVETRHPVRMSRRMRTIVTFALMLMMLTAVGVAAAKLASVTDYPPPSGLTPEYMSHLVTLKKPTTAICSRCPSMTLCLMARRSKLP